MRSILFLSSARRGERASLKLAICGTLVRLPNSTFEVALASRAAIPQIALGGWGDGEMGGWGDGEMGRWGDGEMGGWGDGEMGRWGDGGMGRWGDGGMGKQGKN
ncbi:MAG: hypothetical protein KME17_03845 [Cyanosarcina radialis HA8281-LM2]|jgi:hypothetical protein|nr:hypothetical protein [Cyanosarcina radialis HA8281-LM2]